MSLFKKQYICIYSKQSVTTQFAIPQKTIFLFVERITSKRMAIRWADTTHSSEISPSHKYLSLLSKSLVFLSTFVSSLSNRNPENAFDQQNCQIAWHSGEKERQPEAFRAVNNDNLNITCHYFELEYNSISIHFVAMKQYIKLKQQRNVFDSSKQQNFRQFDRAWERACERPAY